MTNVAATLEQTLATISAAVGGVSDSWDALYYIIGSISVDWTGTDAGDGAAVLQTSPDGQKWQNCDFKAVGKGSGMHSFDLTLFTRFYRVAVSPGSNSAGSVVIKAIGKTPG